MWVRGQTDNPDTIGKAGVPQATRGGQPGGVRDRFWEECGLWRASTRQPGEAGCSEQKGQTVCEQGHGRAESSGTGG